jgi:hypothetical protein
LLSSLGATAPRCTDFITVAPSLEPIRSLYRAADHAA